MNVREACIAEAAFLERAFRTLEVQVAPPKDIPWDDGFVARYVDQTPYQAILLKLARLISGLNCIDILLLHGFVQEQGVIQRTLDEICEDIIFLCIGIHQNDITDTHIRFLKEFWKEEFNKAHWTNWNHDRQMIPRKKIRAYINRSFGQADPSTSDKNGEIISKSYSGYVHAAAPHIMDMYDGEPPRFHLRGMLGTTKISSHVDDVLNYFYRGLLSANFVAKAFGDEVLASQCRERVLAFEQAFKHIILPSGRSRKARNEYP